MSRFWCTCALIALAIGLAVEAIAQTEKTFPTDDEIILVLTQTERAMQQYKPLIDREELEMGKSGTDAIAKDREVVSGLESAVKAFRHRPQGFNGPLGFAFFEWLDDASRNALLCANYASSQVALQVTNQETGKAESLLHLAQSCSDVSTLIYTISENAGSLYQRYVETEEQTATQCGEVLEKCTAILKKKGDSPNK